MYKGKIYPSDQPDESITSIELFQRDRSNATYVSGTPARTR